MDILDLVTIKSDNQEYQYIDRAQAFIDLSIKFKGKSVEVSYHSPASERLVSEFYDISKTGSITRKTVSTACGELDLAC